MKLDRFREKKWFPYAVAACIAVVLYVVLMRLGGIWKGIRTFFGYFSAVWLGCVVAYLVNPLARLYQRSIFRRIRKKGLGWSCSVILALVTVLCCLVYFTGMLAPQLVDSATGFVSNLDGYVAALKETVSQWEFAEKLGLMNILDSYENGVNALVQYLKDNVNGILKTSLAAGRSLFNWVMAVILSIYLLTAKERLQSGSKRLLRAVTNETHYEKVTQFFTRCNAILNRYIIFSLLDSMIVGVANALFMQALGMQYVGLVSMAVAVTNLVPTFGPIVGGFIGSLILLLVRPFHALLFLGFTLLLQTMDGYVIKPRLFGKSLGVSGLMIVIAVILYNDYLLPALEKKKKAPAERK